MTKLGFNFLRIHVFSLNLFQEAQKPVQRALLTLQVCRCLVSCVQLVWRGASSRFVIAVLL